MCFSRSTKILGTSYVLCLHRLWYRVPFCPLQVGKKTAWNVWETHNEIIAAFYELHNAAEQIAEETEASLEYFTILLYDMIATGWFFYQWSQKESVHSQRTSDVRSSSNQRCPTATYEEGSIARWELLGLYHSAISAVALSCWVGWTCPEQWKPLWSSLPKVSATCPELLKCSCRSQCRDCKMCSCTSKMHSLLHMQSWLWQCLRLW